MTGVPIPIHQLGITRIAGHDRLCARIHRQPAFLQERAAGDSFAWARSRTAARNHREAVSSEAKLRTLSSVPCTREKSPAETFAER